MIVFRYSRKVQIGIISIILLFIVFILYCTSLYIIKPSNSFIVVLTFFGSMLGISHILNIIFSKYAYEDMGVITFRDHELIVTYDKEHFSFNPYTIKEIVFEYRGDCMWRARNSIFQKCKSKSRYRIKRLSLGFEKTTFDRIIINSREFYVKIKTFSDKEDFYKLVEWAKLHDLKYELIEDKYYMQFE